MKLSEAEEVSLCCTNMLPLTEPFSGKYLKKLFGNTNNTSEIADGLKRLDRLTQEEVQMAAAQVLKATHTVDDTGRVRGVADIAVDVDSRVAGVGDQVQDVGDQVQDVGDQVQDVGDQVQDVGDQVQDVGDQVQDVGDRVHGVSDQVRGVSNQIQGLDDKVTAVIDGAQYVFYLSP